MKLISLNTWGGIEFDSLNDFIKSHADTDIFCFQEVYKTSSGIQKVGYIRTNLFEDIQQNLPKHTGYFHTSISGYNLDGDKATKVNFDLDFGLGIFLKKEIMVLSKGVALIYKDKQPFKEDFSNLPVYLQYVDIQINSKDFTVCNIHGIPIPGNKLDTPDRIKQSEIIQKLLKSKNNPKILVGDFNLLPDTESIQILEKDMRNLISEFRIERTRSKLSSYWGKPNYQKFADYTFVSREVEVKSFAVPDVEISDHLPLILEFS